MRVLVCIVLLAAQCGLSAAELNPGYNGEQPPNGHETESPFRRGEVLFFISYPFTFLGSLAAYYASAAGIRAIDAGKSDFAPNGGFYGLVAVTAAMLSFGIAMNDYYAIRSEARNDGGVPAGYLSFDFRF